MSTLPPADSADHGDHDDRTVIRPQATGAPATSGPIDASPDAATDVPPGEPTHAIERTQAQPRPQPQPQTDDRTVIRPTPKPAVEHGNALPVGTWLGEFELTGVLGEGGFGIVYLAQDHSLQRRVALKEYMPSSLAARTGATTVAVKSERHRETFELGLKSFVNEARLLAQFDHPSLVKVYRFWEANGTAYMVMPFYEGITVKDRLKEMRQPPDEAWLLGLLGPVTEALQVIHAEHCYHRDIAPDNIILLAGSGRPLLLDFGAARRVIGDMTQALTVILKPGYAPLEQYAEVPSMKQGPWTDVYALAAVVYYAIQGRTPPPAVGRIVGDTYVPLAEAAKGRYSDGFLQAIDRALKVRPEDRTPGIDALRAELGLSGHGTEQVRTAFQPTQLPLSSGGAVAAVATAAEEAPGRTARPPATTAAPVPPLPASGQATPPASPSASPSPSARPRTGLFIGLGAAGLLLVAAGAYVALTPNAPPAAAPAPAPAPAAQAAQDAPTPVAPAVVTQPAGTSPSNGPARVQPTAPVTITGEFERVVQGRSPGFEVRATPARAELRIDRDRLSFDITSQKDGHVYVLDHGPDGAVTLLYPNTQAPQNRIRAGQTLTLPQASWPLVPTGPEGEEELLVIVSDSPRDFSALERGRVHYFAELASGDAAVQAARAHTGPGSVFSGRANCATPGCDVYGAARFSVRIVK